MALEKKKACKNKEFNYKKTEKANLIFYLSTHNFGEEERQIMQILMENLIASKSIQRLQLNNNGFGKGKTANMKYLQKIIANNLRINIILAL